MPSTTEAAADLFKLQLDGLDEGFGDKLCSLAPQLHSSSHPRHLEMHHHTVCVAVYHLTVSFIPIGLIIRLGHQLPATNRNCFLGVKASLPIAGGSKHSHRTGSCCADLFAGSSLLGVLNHLSAIGSCAGGDFQARHLAHSGSSEAIHAVGTHLHPQDRLYMTSRLYPFNSGKP